MQDRPPPRLAFPAVVALLLAVTWLPLLVVHVNRLTLTDQDSGTVLVVFAPYLSDNTAISSVVDAHGSLLRRVGWLGNAWIVHSSSPGFVGELKRRGAWGGFSVALLDPASLLSCLRRDLPPRERHTG